MTKIMLVEDDKSLREIYGVRLSAEGYEITSAGDGEEALAMAVKERPDLILSDVMMPKISGFDMLDILRTTPETKDIKVIMMTALSSEDQRGRGESLGANRYLVKSQVGIEDVVRTVHEVLADKPELAAPTAPAATDTTFSAPIPTEAPQAAPAMPRTMNIPTPPPRPMQQPAEPVVFQNTSTVAPVPTTTLPPQPVQPAMPQLAPVDFAPKVEPSQMPRPTAPFSSPAPASLGDRVINPLQSDTSKPDIATLIDQELGEMPNIPQPPTPPQF
ncbi:MAG: response regulator [Candidatus Saccharibacteria bacterium]